MFKLYNNTPNNGEVRSAALDTDVAAGCHVKAWSISGLLHTLAITSNIACISHAYLQDPRIADESHGMVGGCARRTRTTAELDSQQQQDGNGHRH